MYSNFSKALIRTPIHPFVELDTPLNKANQLFYEGIYIASPEFYHELEKINFKIDSNNEKLLMSLYKYWIRSCMRCTPYGTFAGCSIIDINSNTTDLTLNSSNQFSKKVRLDMNYISNLVATLNRNDKVRNVLKYHLNNSLYEHKNGYRYAEYTIIDNTRKYNLVSIRKTSVLKAIVTLTSKGCSLADLNNKILHKFPNYSAIQIANYINQLIESQILISELEPSITGYNPFTQLYSRLQGKEIGNDIKLEIEEIQEILTTVSNGTKYYSQLESHLSSTPLGNVQVEKNAVQVDLFLSFKEKKLNTEVVKEIVTQANDLVRLSRKNVNANLERFKENFRKKYEDQIVPLIEALDPESGIGYAEFNNENTFASEFLDDLYISYNTNNQNNSKDRITNLVEKKYLKYLESKNTTIEILEADLQELPADEDLIKYPDSVSLMGSLKAINDKLDKNNFLFEIKHMGGPSGANLMGRFAYGDHQINELIKQVISKEEANNPDAIYAEIVHLPQARIGNILLRPTFRNFEIPYIGLSGLHLNNQINITDLLISIRNGEVLLYSKKKKKQVIPRLTTAHNFGLNSLPIYKFLCDLQYQNNARIIIWDWGTHKDNDYLPRVTYKNLILHKARWLLRLNDFGNKPLSTDQMQFELLQIRKAKKIPQKVILSQGDNDLLLNLENKLNCAILIQELRRHGVVQITENTMDADSCIVKNHDKKGFVNELIIPLYKEISKVEKRPLKAFKTTSKKVRRTFSPGSDWIYLKIYCSINSADKILTEIIAPFIRNKKQSLTGSFFFIRYNDEYGYHLRIRIYNTNETERQTIQHNLLKTINRKKAKFSIFRLTLDTYERELERYSTELIDDTETLFCNDSISTLNLLSLISQIEEQEKMRIIIAMRSIDALFDDFGIGAKVKYEILKNSHLIFFKEFGESPSLLKQLNNKYRTLQREIWSFMEVSNDHDNNFDDVTRILSERTKLNLKVVESIKNKLSNSNPDYLFNFIPSYVHMLMNRLFNCKQRKYELLVYHHMERYLKSKIARKSK